MHDIATSPVTAPFKRQSLCGEDVSVEEEENLASGRKLAVNLSHTVSGAIGIGVIPAVKSMKARFKRFSREGIMQLHCIAAVPKRTEFIVTLGSVGCSEGVKQMSVTCEAEMVNLGKELYKSVLDKYSKFIANTKRKKNITDREVAEFAWTTEVFDMMYNAADGDVSLKMTAIRFEKQYRMDFINRLLQYSNEYTEYDKGLFKFTLEM